MSPSQQLIHGVYLPKQHLSRSMTSQPINITSTITTRAEGKPRKTSNNPFRVDNCHPRPKFCRSNVETSPSPHLNLVMRVDPRAKERTDVWAVIAVDGSTCKQNSYRTESHTMATIRVIQKTRDSNLIVLEALPHSQSDTGSPLGPEGFPLLEKWNQPRINIHRTFATFWSFLVMGANDAAYGVS